jgi:hypothetical protein
VQVLLDGYSVMLFVGLSQNLQILHKCSSQARLHVVIAAITHS